MFSIASCHSDKKKIRSIKAWNYIPKWIFSPKFWFPPLCIGLSYFYSSLLFSSLNQTFLYVTQKAGFCVTQIFIEGRTHVALNALKKQLAIEIGDPIFLHSLGEIKQKVESFPWIKEAKIKRLLPGSFYIYLNEHVPLAIWKSKKGFSLIDTKGNIIPCPDSENPSNLPIIIGENAPKNFLSLQPLLEKFAKAIPVIHGALFLRSLRWNLYLENNIVVKLPENDIAHALARLSHMKHFIAKHLLASIDLRFSDAIIIEYKSSSGDQKR